MSVNDDGASRQLSVAGTVGDRKSSGGSFSLFSDWVLDAIQNEVEELLLFVHEEYAPLRGRKIAGF